MDNIITYDKLPDAPVVQPIELQMDHKIQTFVAPFNENDLNDTNKALLDKYGKIFNTNVDWTKNANYYPFNYKGPIQRPKLVDFLITLGFFESSNKIDFREQSDKEKVESAIKDFDDIDILPIIPIKIIHVLPSDNSIKYQEEHLTRMTPLMEEFIKQIGEPLEINDENADKRKWPRLKTTIPSIPCSNGFVGFISPAFTNDEKAIEKIDSLLSPIVIIFNETNFRINPVIPSYTTTLYLIVKPMYYGLYSVIQSNEITDPYSPFCNEQIMSLETLILNISVYIESINFKAKNKKIIKDRRMVLTELSKSQTIQEIGLISSGLFK